MTEFRITDGFLDAVIQVQTLSGQVLNALDASVLQLESASSQQLVFRFDSDSGNDAFLTVNGNFVTATLFDADPLNDTGTVASATFSQSGQNLADFAFTDTQWTVAFGDQQLIVDGDLGTDVRDASAILSGEIGSLANPDAVIDRLRLVDGGNTVLDLALDDAAGQGLSLADIAAGVPRQMLAGIDDVLDLSGLTTEPLDTLNVSQFANILTGDVDLQLFLHVDAFAGSLQFEPVLDSRVPIGIPGLAGFETATLADIIGPIGLFETVIGSSGNDVISFEANELRSLSLTGGVGRDTIFAGLGDDTLRGGDGDDFLTAGGGDDLLFGGAGFDFLFAGEGDDTITPGSNGNFDLIEPGGGANVIDLVGAGNDFYVLEYRNRPTGIDVDFDAATATVAHDGVSDTVLGIDLVEGNIAGFQVLGTALDDTFAADLSDENRFIDFAPGAGNDTIDGGEAFVRVSYFNAPGGISFNASTGQIFDGFGGVDTFSGLDEIRGSNFADFFLGGAGDDRFIPRGGNDTIEGGAGRDLVRYDRAGVEFVNVDLATGVATGVRQGQTFQHSLSDIEKVRGSLTGDDNLSGTDGDERFEGRGGDDTLLGQDGADTLLGGAGDDRLLGGEGFDVAKYTDASGGVVGFLGLASSVSGADIGVDTLFAVEAIFGSNFDDTLTASDTFDNEQSFLFGAGRQFNVLDGRLGDDLITGNGLTRLSFADATDAVTANIATGVATGGSSIGTDSFSGVFEVQGTGLDDVLTGSDTGADVDLQDLLDGRFESFIGGGGSDTVDGGLGIDRLNFTGSNNGTGINISLGAGTVVDGFGDVDTFTGIEGVRGTEFNDTLVGDDGDNFLEPQGGDDVVDGGGGSDTVLFAIRSAGVTVDLSAGTATDGTGGTDTLISIENAIGSGFDDALTGDATSNQLLGFFGDDTLSGGGGADTLLGGAGNDSLSGGAGQDVFLIRAAAGDDRITDFDTTLDRVDVSDFGLTSLGDLLLLGTQSNDDFVVQLAADQTVTLAGLEAGDLQAGGFVFANDPGQPKQIVSPVVGGAIVGSGDAFVVSAEYTTSDPVDPTLAGLGLRIHFDSSVLTFGGFANLFQTGLQAFGRVAEEDTSDFDGDAATDTFVAVNWADLGQNFPGVDVQVLYDALFTSVNGQDGTINFTASSTAGGRSFAGESFDVIGDRWPLPDAVAVAENSADGTQVADLAAGLTLDPADPGVFSLLDDAAGRFELDGFVLRVADGAGLDFEAADSHELTLRITSNTGAVADRTLTVDLTDVNEAPTAVALDAASVAEDATANTVVGQLSGDDPEGDDLIFALLDDAGGRFALDGDQIVVAGDGVLDFETAQSHQIRVEARDGDGLSFADILTIDVTDVAEATLDLDGDGVQNALSDGLIALGRMFGAPVSQLTGFAASGSPGADAATLDARLQEAEAGFFDVDGDGTANALSDGLMILGFLFGAPTSQLAGFANPDGTRTTADEIGDFLGAVDLANAA